MKRLFILVAAVLAISSSIMARNVEDCSLFSKLIEKEKFDGLVNYLKANSEQREYLKEIFAISVKKVEKAKVNGIVSDMDAQKAIVFNLANTKDVLSPEQYKKYLIVLNMTLNNAQVQGLFAEK